jgi:K+-transporting ATPase ATPase C chain
MRKDLISGVVAALAFTLLLGVAYPLVVTGVSQVAFGSKADGERSLIGVPRLKGKDPDPAYFTPRPSATGYSATATYFSNRAPSSSAARSFYRDQVRSYLAANGRYDPGLTVARIPQDAVTTSASGVDPHITPANAAIQAHRIAAVRHLPLDRVTALVDEHTDGRALGVFGEPGVNVVLLNAALDRETR